MPRNESSFADHLRSFSSSCRHDLDAARSKNQIFSRNRPDHTISIKFLNGLGQYLFPDTYTSNRFLKGSHGRLITHWTLLYEFTAHKIDRVWVYILVLDRCWYYSWQMGANFLFFFFEWKSFFFFLISDMHRCSEIEFWSIKLLLFLSKFLISNASLYDFYFQRFDYLKNFVKYVIY